MVRTKQNLLYLSRWTIMKLVKGMKQVIKEGKYKGISVITEEQVIKAAETLLQES